jgi:hypothetical protein
MDATVAEWRQLYKQKLLESPGHLMNDVTREISKTSGLLRNRPSIPTRSAGNHPSVECVPSVQQDPDEADIGILACGFRKEFAESEFSTNHYRELQQDISNYFDELYIDCDDCSCEAYHIDWVVYGSYFVTYCLNSYLDQGYTQICLAYSYSDGSFDSCSLHLDAATCPCKFVVCSNGSTEVSDDCTTVGFNIVGSTCYADFEDIIPGMLSCYEGPGDPDPIKFQQQLILPSLQAPYQTTDSPTEPNTPLPTDPSIPENTKPPKPNGSLIVEGQDDEGLSVGATVGIVFAILGLVLVAVIASILLIVRLKKLTEQRTRPVAKEEKVQPPEAPPPVVVGNNEESASLATNSTMQADCFWRSPNTATNHEEVQPPEAPPPVVDEEVRPPFQ